ncbi:LexA family protein [Bradyrhizobium sp. sBnM-33]|uniref:LexA family protein n=2 Tax=unclassified Bradyrhizobium TaxID=2631580 RepID=UPI00293E3B4A|nr:MarR family transcriptional regulator [Bradyrhizobium sp. sBnM-33]WOH52859.1 MarR family transcriptional regulator [Bradyrhizobium sp. sBnM-33]
MSQKSGARFTEKQGHYLAFIHTYSYMFGQPPAEADIQRHFRVSPPTVHQMIVTLERNGFIRRQPGVPRSIEILLPPENLPSSNGSVSKRQNHYDEPLGMLKSESPRTARRAASSKRSCLTGRSVQCRRASFHPCPRIRGVLFGIG